MRSLIKLIPAALAAFLLASCGRQDPAGRPTLTVYAAASLTDALQEIGSRFERANSATVSFNFAGSGTLAQQLIAAPRADIFISASESWMDKVEESGNLAPGSRQVLLSNGLALIANRDSDFQLKRLSDLPSLGFRLLAMGDPESVPAGRYAKRWLESVSNEQQQTIWSQVSDRISPTPDVRAALAQVASQQDVIGIVYTSDYQARRAETRALLAAPQEIASTIAYPAALVSSSENAELAKAFIHYLRLPESISIFRDAGFTVLPAKSLE